MKNRADYNKYKCPYEHLEKECGHELKGPEGYEDTYGIWCECGFRGPVFYLEPDELKLELINQEQEVNLNVHFGDMSEALAKLNVRKGQDDETI